MSSLPSKFIIVADDYADVAAIMAELIAEISAHQAVAVVNGAEALELARKRRPDVCLLDIEMPVMGGIEAARQLHAMYGDDRPVIIGMSGRQDLDPQHTALFDLFLYKPLTIETVFDFIDPPPNSDDENAAG